MPKNKLKICILSRGESLYSTQRLFIAGKNNGHEMEIIDPLGCHLNLSDRKPEMLYQGKKLDYFDAIIPRFGSSINFHGTAILRQFEAMGIYTLNKPQAISIARDKLSSLQMLSRAKVKIPKTAYAYDVDNITALIKSASGIPLVVKVVSGTHGRGVILAPTANSAYSLIETFRNQNVDIIVQEFIQESKGSDLRCLVIGNSVVAAMKRTAQPGEFRSNLHCGGTSEIIKLTQREEEIAIQATKIIGLNVAGVDIIRSRRGALVLEVNASPGLEGIETTTSIDIANLVIKFIEKNYRKTKPS